jgi:hypothetical protein
MSRYDEPTQQVRRPQPQPAPLPGSLDPLRGHQTETGTGWVETADEDIATADATGVLPLEEIFDTTASEPAAPLAAEPIAPASPARASTAATEAPTWTAMPVVPVRSEPVAMGEPYQGPQRHDRDRDGASVAWVGTRIRIEDWLRRDDNGLMLLTAIVACVLMIVVAGVGS